MRLLTHIHKHIEMLVYRKQTYLSNIVYETILL